MISHVYHLSMADLTSLHPVYEWYMPRLRHKALFPLILHSAFRG